MIGRVRRWWRGWKSILSSVAYLIVVTAPVRIPTLTHQDVDDLIATFRENWERMGLDPEVIEAEIARVEPIWRAGVKR